MPDYDVGLGANAITPTITDQIWGDHGVRFDRAWAQPTCSLTRASCLTGRFPFRHGIGKQISLGGVPFVSNFSPEEQEETVAQILRSLPGANQYITGAIGKWHLSRFASLTNSDPSGPQNLGFDYFAGQLFPVTENYCHLPNDPGWMTDIYSNGAVQPPVQSVQGEYLIAQQIQFAIDFFSDSITEDSTRPVFLWIGLQAPFELHQRPDPIQYPHPQLPFTFLTPGCAQAIAGDEQDCFDATLQAADKEIGRFLQSITDNGLGNWWDSTTVILLGDNGSPSTVPRAPFSDKHLKDSLFEGGVRVPFYISGRAVDQATRASAVEDSPVQALDLFQTILEIAGASASGSRTIDSLSLLSLVDGSSTTPVRDELYSESFSQNYQSNLPHKVGDRRIAYREDVDGDWKLFHTPGSSQGSTGLIDLLFDLAVDEFEESPPLIPTTVGDPNAALYNQKVLDLRAQIQALLDS